MKREVCRRRERLLGLSALTVLLGLTGGPVLGDEQVDTVYEGVNYVSISAHITEPPYPYQVTAPFQLTGDLFAFVSCGQSGGSWTASGSAGLDWNGSQVGSDPWSLEVPAGQIMRQDAETGATINGPTGARIGAVWMSTTAGTGLTVTDSHLFQVS